MSSGDDVETGRTKVGESTTAIDGGRPSELDVPFNGIVVFTAGARTDAQRPDTPVCGVRGVGWNGFGGPLNSVPTPGGCGVIGWGAENRGTGVIGLGGGARHQGPFITWTVGPDGPAGSGGVGVFGRGGDGFLSANTSSSIGPFSFNGHVAGAGIVGRGGASHVPATEVPDPGEPERRPHGPGVVGVAGGMNEAAFPSETEAGGVGVFGRGAAAGEQFINAAVGMPDPGPGMVGQGGRAEPAVAPNPQPLSASGVVGVVGDRALPPHSQLRGCGVIGLATTGPAVYGEAPGGPGVRGLSEGGPGGARRVGEAAGGRPVLARACATAPRPARPRRPERRGRGNGGRPARDPEAAGARPAQPVVLRRDGRRGGRRVGKAELIAGRPGRGAGYHPSPGPNGFTPIAASAAQAVAPRWPRRG